MTRTMKAFRLISIIASLIMVSTGSLIGLSLLAQDGSKRMAFVMLGIALTGALILLDLCVIEPRNRNTPNRRG